MRYFNTFVSATAGAGGSQYPVSAEMPQSCRIYYKLFFSGTYDYSLLFCNIIDSTFDDGSVGHVNMLGGEWEVLSASVGLADSCSAESAPDPVGVRTLTFEGEPRKKVSPGEYFTSDPVSLTAVSGQYLCLEMSYVGEGFLAHLESILPAFSCNGDNAWVRNTLVPFPSHIGCSKPVSARVGFIGDSVTQGCGTEVNSYTNWAAVVSEMLGCEYSFWNMGLGYARASDAATDSTWLYKAKQVDVSVVCFGVNDIVRGHSAEQIKDDLLKIVTGLKAAGVRVLIQTVPPFNFTEERLERWIDVNAYIRGTLFKLADGFFDCAAVLSVNDGCQAGMSRFDPHPCAIGCRVWAEGLYPVLKAMLEKRQ